MKLFTLYLYFPKISENIFLSVLYEGENIFKVLLKKIYKYVFIQNKKVKILTFI